MARITALNRSKGRVNLFLDGEFICSLSAALVSEEGLKTDQVLDPARIDSLVKRDRFQRGLNTATRYLAVRPRSDYEIRAKLKNRGYDAQTQDSVIENLRTKGLLDDTAFAQYWAENRDSFSPRSQRLTGIELQKKGVAREVIARAVGTIDDDAAAYRAASGRARNIRWKDYDQFRRRIGGYLERRGFTYGTISTTLKKVWKEIELETKSSIGTDI